MEADIELRQLRYFVVVAEELNFTRAAERLRMAQPPLSRQIQALEQSLGVVLFERTNRRVSLTVAGEAFLNECRHILQSIESSIRITQNVAQGEMGQLIVGFEGAAHNPFILKLLRQFRSQFPNVELIMQEMSSGKQVEALSSGRIDLGLIEPIAAQGNLEMFTLFSEPLVLAMHDEHPLTQHKSLTLKQLANEKWVTGRSDCGCGLLLRILEACKKSGFIPNIQQETNDLQMTLGFVATNLGVTLLPESSALEQQGITYRSLKSTPRVESQLTIAWHSDRTSPVISSFLEMVKQYIQNKQGKVNIQHRGVKQLMDGSTST